MTYSKEATITFSNSIGYSECLTDLNSLISNDGCVEKMPVFNDCCKVLNMDCVENKIAKLERRTNNKSMDSLFVARDENGTEEIVFVEYRFNYQSMKNLKIADLRGKKKFSTKNINNFGYTNIHSKFYYIFNSNLKAQARNYFKRQYPKMPNNFKPIDIMDLKNTFFNH